MSSRESNTLAIIGQGYVGLPLAMAAVEAGWNVVGIDSLQSKVGQINRGESTVEDIPDAKLKAAIASGAYRATQDYSVLNGASVIAICVPTPLNNKREPDLTLLKGAVLSLAPYVSEQTLILSESTSYPGTLRDVIIPIVEANKALGVNEIYYACAPERVNPGDRKWNQKNTPRLIGAIDIDSQERALEFYRTICDSVVLVSKPEIAEAAKLLENSFRLVNIALVNQLAQICGPLGLNVNEVIDAAATKPYGFMAFRPGVGVGGHCIPVDPMYLTWWARRAGNQATMIDVADEINLSMPSYVAERALSLIGDSIRRPNVLILGVAYKPGVSDVRETPAAELLKQLESRGAKVAWHDPLVKFWEGTSCVDLDWQCDLAILVTNQPGLELEKLISRGVKVLDCTNSLNLDCATFSL